MIMKKGISIIVILVVFIVSIISCSDDGQSMNSQKKPTKPPVSIIPPDFYEPNDSIDSVSNVGSISEGEQIMIYGELTRPDGTPEKDFFAFTAVDEYNREKKEGDNDFYLKIEFIQNPNAAYAIRMWRFFMGPDGGNNTDPTSYDKVKKDLFTSGKYKIDDDIDITPVLTPEMDPATMTSEQLNAAIARTEEVYTFEWYLNSEEDEKVEWSGFLFDPHFPYEPKKYEANEYSMYLKDEHPEQLTVSYTSYYVFEVIQLPDKTIDPAIKDKSYKIMIKRERDE
jgi:hypothetical protein